MRRWAIDDRRSKLSLSVVHRLSSIVRLPRFAVAFAEDDAVEREATGVSFLRALRAPDGEQGADLRFIGQVELAFDGCRIKAFHRRGVEAVSLGREPIGREAGRGKREVLGVCAAIGTQKE